MSWLGSLRSRSRLKKALRLVGRDDICIDCGANVGEYTELMASTGATVYAFEPDPNVFEVLSKRFRLRANVVLINKAVSGSDGRSRLYFHKDQPSAPVRFSKSSTLFREKEQAGDHSIEIETVSLAGFIKSIEHPIAVLKMDIEGAEIEVLNALLDADLASRIGQAFVELHDRKIASLAGPTARLRERLASMDASHFHLDWH